MLIQFSIGPVLLLHSEREQNISGGTAERARVSGRGEDHAPSDHGTSRTERASRGGHVVDSVEVPHLSLIHI